LGQFLTNLLVGVWRFRRGEQLSARQLITVSSLYALLRLIPKHIATPQSGMLDNLDPLRRFEMVYPEIATEINRWLGRDLEQTATGLLDLADHLLHDLIANYPTEAVEVVRQQISP
jgi:lincosamide nucleotidyltransferase